MSGWLCIVGQLVGMVLGMSAANGWVGGPSWQSADFHFGHCWVQVSGRVCGQACFAGSHQQLMGKWAARGCSQILQAWLRKGPEGVPTGQFKISRGRIGALGALRQCGPCVGQLARGAPRSTAGLQLPLCFLCGAQVPLLGPIGDSSTGAPERLTRSDCRDLLLNGLDLVVLQAQAANCPVPVVVLATHGRLHPAGGGAHIFKMPFP